MVHEGLALRLYAAEAPDVSRLAPGVWVPVDVPRTDSLVWNIYQYAGLFDVDSLDLDPTNRNIAGNLSLPYLVLGGAYQALGDRERMLENFRRAYHLSPGPGLRNLVETALLDSMGDAPAGVPLGIFDSVASPSDTPSSPSGIDPGR